MAVVHITLDGDKIRVDLELLGKKLSSTWTDDGLAYLCNHRMDVLAIAEFGEDFFTPTIEECFKLLSPALNFDAVQNIIEDLNVFEQICKDTKIIVMPQRKAAQWIKKSPDPELLKELKADGWFPASVGNNSVHWECSACGCRGMLHWNYCPKCGENMHSERGNDMEGGGGS